MSASNFQSRKLSSQDDDFIEALNQLLNRQKDDVSDVDQTVSEIIDQVRASGDSALKKFTLEFDSFDLDQTGFEISTERCLQALENIDQQQRAALEYAADRIEQYHQHQVLESWQYQEQDGTELGQKITALKRVGLYVPGGKATYPSSVLMNAIPAKVAGVDELIVVTPTPNGELNEMVLAAAHIAGVDTIFRIGGAQAVAALAYGTETIPAVDKITGPGNIFVATAKKQVFGKVGIDMIAGPSEVLIIADESVNPDWVAMDLFAQAEHDENAQSILLTTSVKVADAVEQSIIKLLPEMDRASIIAASLNNNGALITVDSEQDLIEIADLIAAEHLEIFHQNAELLAQQINNAGAIFIGEYSAESLGDYCAGPNHVLPTSGTARFSSPLGVYDFQKRTSTLKISQKGAHSIGENASILAEGESLMAHARSAQYRLKNEYK